MKKQRFWTTDDSFGVRAWSGPVVPKGAVEITAEEAAMHSREPRESIPSRWAAYYAIVNVFGDAIDQQSAVALAHWRDTGIVMRSPQRVPAVSGLEDATGIKSGQLEEYLKSLNDLGKKWYVVDGRFVAK